MYPTHVTTAVHSRRASLEPAVVLQDVIDVVWSNRIDATSGSMAISAGKAIRADPRDRCHRQGSRPGISLRSKTRNRNGRDGKHQGLPGRLQPVTSRPWDVVAGERGFVYRVPGGRGRSQHGGAGYYRVLFFGLRYYHYSHLFAKVCDALRMVRN